MRTWTILALVAALPLPAGAAPKPKLAVMELKAGQGMAPQAAATLTTILAADAARVGLDVISQAEVVTMLGFQKQRQMLGCTDDGCLAELGGALGADYVLSGEVALVGSRHHVCLSLLDPGKATVVARSAGFSEAGDDALALAALARFRALVGEARPDLAATAPPVDPPFAAGLRARRTGAWWTLGGGAVLLAGGAAAGLVARSQYQDLVRSWQQPGYQGRYDQQRRTALTADVLFGAGTVTAGVGLWLYLTSDIPVVVLPVAADGLPGVTFAGRF